MASASPHTTLKGPHTRLERLIHTPAGGLRVGALDALFHIHGNAAAQGIGSRLQFLIQLFQHRVLRRVPPHQNRRAQLVQRRDAVCFSRGRFWNPESSELPSGIQTHPPREGRYSTKSFSLRPTFLGKTIRFLNRCGSSKSANKTKDCAVNGTQLTQAMPSYIQRPFCVAKYLLGTPKPLNYIRWMQT